VKVKEKKIEQEEDIKYEEELFELLREKRAYFAKELSLPAYIIFGNKTLKYLASKKPFDKDTMLEVNGVGERKYEQFGEEFLKVISKYNSSIK
jgi:ATP-dependent DNA helicase RecQ